MAFVKEYEIDIAGTSNGLVLPANFRITIVCARIDTTATGEPVLNCQVPTYVDSTHALTVLNDDIAQVHSFALVAADLSTAVNTLADAKVRPLIDTAYGAGNVTVIT